MTSPMTRARLEELKLRLEAAKEGTRELDCDIERAAVPDSHIHLVDGDPTVFKAHPNETGWHWEAKGIVGNVSIPYYTTSLDAALTLVPEGWDWQVSGPGFDRAGYFASVREIQKELGRASRRTDAEGWTRKAPTPALALCIAALSARAALLPEHPDDVMEEK